MDLKHFDSDKKEEILESIIEKQNLNTLKNDLKKKRKKTEIEEISLDKLLELIPFSHKF